MTTTGPGLSLGIVVSETTAVRPGAQPHDDSGIGFVRFGEVVDEDVSVQSSTAEKLMEIGDAFYEAARRLQGLQLTDGATWNRVPA